MYFGSKNKFRKLQLFHSKPMSKTRDCSLKNQNKQTKNTTEKPQTHDMHTESLDSVYHHKCINSYS